MAAPQQAFMMAGTTSAYSAVIYSGSYIRTGSTPCGVIFKSDGTVWAKEASGYTYRYNWLTGAGTGADYQIRNTLNASSPDTFSSGTMSTWQALSTDREWTRASSSWVEREAIGDFEIRQTASGIVLALNTISLFCFYGTGPIP